MQKYIYQNNYYEATAIASNRQLSIDLNIYSDISTFPPNAQWQLSLFPPKRYLFNPDAACGQSAGVFRPRKSRRRLLLNDHRYTIQKYTFKRRKTNITTITINLCKINECKWTRTVGCGRSVGAMLGRHRDAFGSHPGLAKVHTYGLTKLYMIVIIIFNNGRISLTQNRLDLLDYDKIRYER